MTSPLLALPGAVAGDGVDAPVAGHYGSFNTEQRALEELDGFVDLSHHDVLRISGPDRLTWLHALTTQYFEGLRPGSSTTALLLSPTGHIEHAMYGYDDGETFWLHTEPGAAADVQETWSEILTGKAHVYSREHGRLGAIAKGARMVKSRLGGRLEPLSRVNLILRQGRGDLCTVTGVDTVEAHPGLRES